MMSFNANALNATIDQCFDTIAAAAEADSILKPIAMHNTVLHGLSLVQPPDAAKPYADQ